MDGLFQKKKLKSISESASLYLKENYNPPEPIKAEHSGHGIKYSSRGDFFDIDSISRNVGSFISGQKGAEEVLDDIEENTDMTFVDKFLEYVSLSRERDSRIYKAANVDRRLYSKIISDRNYKPAKDTCISLALALNLPLDQTKDLIERAGYALSHSTKRDVIIEYFFKEGIFNIEYVNEVLISLNEKPLGR